MIDRLRAFLAAHRQQAYALLRPLADLGRPFLLHTDLEKILEEYCAREDCSAIAELETIKAFFASTQEAIVTPTWICFALRLAPGRWEYLRIHQEQLGLEALEVDEFLRLKELQILPQQQGPVLTVDFAPFRRNRLRLRNEESIGHGLVYMNRQLGGQLFADIESGRKRILDFLTLHKLNGQPLMTFDRAPGFEDLREAVQFLRRLPKALPWADFAAEMARRGFAPGWGNTAERTAETMRMLMELLDAPSAQNLETFMDRIPMISQVLILSIHGWFAQDQVLGRPDTGGQVVYILDQARALEREMRQRFIAQGVDIEPRILIATRLIPAADGTTCNERLESVNGSENVQILRVPFREENGEIVPQWISRFAVWPYLERYAEDLERESLAEFGRRPDLLIGNYSDGNLVASLLSNRLGVTQCNIAHALEKSKYLFADLYWQDHEETHHFACQFTADLISMNAADIVVTSTYQEIAGTDDEIGQYESHQDYTLPRLYRVVNGIDVYDAKFNIVSPGADAHYYFPYDAEAKRLRFLSAEIDELLFGQSPGEDRRGVLREPHKPILFSMARLDRIKNLTGLAELFGASPRLRQLANLVIIGGHVQAGRSGDREEQEEIRRMHAIMDQYHLDGEMRWLGMLLDKNVAGELYRCVADHRGVFVQPALFEAFGLTVIEAMSSGLPVFATRFGGPLEIIEDGVSGFHIDPTDHQGSAERIIAFLEAAQTQPETWEAISRGGIARVAARYTWQSYAERLMTLARIYGFWRYAQGMDRAPMRRYLEMFYHLQWRPLAAAIASGSPAATADGEK